MRAFITGITGQDGSHLADYLLSLGYEVHGLVRRTSVPNHERINHLRNRVMLHEGNVTDQASIIRAVMKAKPDEIYNLAAQSFVGVSWDQPVVTCDVNGQGAVRVYEAARQLRDEYGESPRVYQASTSEMFGNADESPQSETTPFNPRSPYGASKVYAHQMAHVYRESFDLFIACGILFNHEGPRRGEQFVTRKITQGVARIASGHVVEPIKLGNLDAGRDWGFAPDYVKAMHLMLQQVDPPDDYVIGTGTTRTVRDFLSAAFDAVGIDGWEKYVEIDPAFLRPAELHTLRADATRAEESLGWKPETPFRKWVAEMVQSDLERCQTNRTG